MLATYPKSAIVLLSVSFLSLSSGASHPPIGPIKEHRRARRQIISASQPNAFGAGTIFDQSGASALLPSLAGLFNSLQPTTTTQSPNQAIFDLLQSQFGSRSSASNAFQLDSSGGGGDQAFMSKCLNWLLGGMLDGLTGNSQSTQRTAPQTFNPFSADLSKNLPSLGGLSPFGFSTDQILERFSPEQRQVLQNMHQDQNANFELDHVQPLPQPQALTAPPGPDDYQARALRNMQILRELRQQNQRQKVTVLTDDGMIRPLVNSDPLKGPSQPNTQFGGSAQAADYIRQAIARGNANAAQAASPFDSIIHPASRIDSSLVQQALAAASSLMGQKQPDQVRRSVKQPDFVENSANMIMQLLQNGQKNKMVLDTGNGQFDRVLLHDMARVDALGYPVAGSRQSKGLYWGDGNVRLVNENREQLLGVPTRTVDQGFTLPLAGLWRDAGGLPQPEPETNVDANGQRDKQCDGGVC